MKRIFFAAVALLFCTALSSQTNALDKYRTVYKDENVTFRKLDRNTWIGSGNVMSSESLYLLAGRDRAVLIDAGTTIPRLKEIATEIAGKPVTLVLTHVHPDHAGAVDSFDEVWINPGDTVNIPEFMPEYKGDVRYLEDGQVLDLGGRVLDVYFTPGHTPGSVTFLEKGTDRGFCGDAFGTGKGNDEGGLLVFTDMETISGTCKKAAEHFERNGYRKLYCGHFHGDNCVTPERVKFVRSFTAQVKEGKIESAPFDGFMGLNYLATNGKFTVRFIKR